MGQDSVSGSGRCTFCAAEFYRPDVNSSAAECESCEAILGASCGSDTAIGTVHLVTGHWRHSTATLETWRCHIHGNWTPCSGGIDAGFEGDGYCAAGYRGPRCELCDEALGRIQFFDKLDARCHDCGDIAARLIPFASILLLLCILLFGAFDRDVPTCRRPACAAASKSLRGPTRLFLKWVAFARKLWGKAGMQFKVKAVVGFYQCVAAVPGVYQMTPPPGLEEYARSVSCTLETTLLPPPSCRKPILLPSTYCRYPRSNGWPITARPQLANACP
jgi:hypothetical protein